VSSLLLVLVPAVLFLRQLEYFKAIRMHLAQLIVQTVPLPMLLVMELLLFIGGGAEQCMILRSLGVAVSTAFPPALVVFRCVWLWLLINMLVAFLECCAVTLSGRI